MTFGLTEEAERDQKKWNLQDRFNYLIEDCPSQRLGHCLDEFNEFLRELDQNEKNSIRQLTQSEIRETQSSLVNINSTGDKKISEKFRSEFIETLRKIGVPNDLLPA